MAVDRLTAGTATELRDHGVAVVSLWPGAVRTEVVEKILDGKSGGAFSLSNPELFSDLESLPGDERARRGRPGCGPGPDIMRWSGKVALTPE